jgi:tetratricopeptide (TPR) repeat protein
MCLLAFLRHGDIDKAVNFAEILMKRKMTSDVALQVAQAMLGAGRPDDALSVARKALESYKEAPGRLDFVAAQAVILSGASREDALSYFASAHKKSPEDIVILRAYGDQLLQAGLYEDAIEILGRAARKAPQLVTLQLLYARALKHAGRYAEAGEITLSASRIDPRSGKSKRVATGALLQAGREDEARALYREMVDERRRKLKVSFEDELQSLNDRLAEARIPASRFDWGWRVSAGALGEEPSKDRQDWENRARWGFLADAALMDWLECNPQSIDKLSEILEGVDEVRAKVSKITREGKGALFASAHVGPMFAGPLVLHKLGAPNRWLSSTPRISTTAYAESLISTSDLTEAQVAKRIKESVQAGYIVVIAVDGAMSPIAPRIEWQGASVTYSDFTAVTSYRYGVPAYFAAPYWNNMRIHFILEPLPTPGQDESLKDFLNRWRSAYFGQLLEYFRRGPESLRMTGGIWRHT